jgi:ComF family protein
VVSKWRQWIPAFFLPTRCIACGQPGHSLPQITGNLSKDIDLCVACYQLLPVNSCACARCGLPLSRDELVCGRCLRRSPPYEYSFCAFEYGYPVEHLIQQLKYSGSFKAARVLSHLLQRYLLERHVSLWPSCIVPMPLHPIRYHERGYNQAIELGRFLAPGLRIPLRTDLLQRVRHTREQVGLTRAERRKNLRRAFAVTAVTMPKHVAVLDDVITTGSTAIEVARTLKAAGVEQIEVWGLARASGARTHAKQ